MRQIIKVQKESVINTLLKNKKSKDFTILYHSMWDENSKKIVRLSEEWAKVEDLDDTVLYTVSSWDLPHAFMAFRVTKTPTLVRCVKGRIRLMDYNPHLHKFFTEGNQ